MSDFKIVSLLNPGNVVIGVLTASAGTQSRSSGLVSFADSNGVSFGLNNGTLTASIAGGGGVAISGGANSQSTGTVTFSNSNGVSFGLDGAGVMTASHNGLTSQSNQAFSAGGGSSTFQTLSFRNANGISFSNSGGSVEASYTVPAAQTGVSGIEVSNTTYTSGTVTFRNANGISFGSSGANGVSASYTVPTVTNSSWTVSDNGTSGTVARLAFTNQNGITLSLSTGAGGSHTIVGSHNALTSQSNQAFSAAGGSSAFQTLGFSDNAHLSFSNSNGSVVAQPIKASLFAVSNTTQSSSGTQNLSGISFAGAGIASVGVTNGSVVVSVPTGAPSPVNFSAGTTSNDLGSVVFSNSNGVSFGLNGSTITASVNAGGGATLSGFQPYADALWVTSGIGNASLWIDPKDVDAAFQYDRFVMPLHFSQATNSTLTVSNTIAWGFYTRNGSTLSLYKSGSGTFSINGSGTASSANNSGIRVVSLASTDTITAGNYYLGMVWRSSSAGANASLSHIAVSQWASTISGYLGLASNTRMNYHPAGGVWTSTTAGPVPNSIAFSDIRGNSSAFQRVPVYHFTSGEITF
jgi:hypothetical protein